MTGEWGGGVGSVGRGRVKAYFTRKFITAVFRCLEKPLELWNCRIVLTVRLFIPTYIGMFGASTKLSPV